MAITWYTSSGQPTDSVGADGDLCWDTLQRITWGPKGKTTAGTWVGTAYSNIGPTGPGLLAGSGAPASGMGQQGNAYIDVSGGTLWLRGGNGWASQGAVVPSFSPILQGSGPPNSNTAPAVQIGQMYYDQQNSLLYGPATSASAAGLTQVTNVVGPTGATGPQGSTTSYRHSLRGSTWIAGTPTANLAYPVCVLISSASTTSGSQGYNIPIAEPMYAAGSLTALSAFSNGGGAGTWTINILKNGTIVYTATSFITSGQTAATAYKSLPASGLSFAVSDVITMTASTSQTTANQYVFVNLFYTTNS